MPIYFRRVIAFRVKRYKYGTCCDVVLLVDYCIKRTRVGFECFECQASAAQVLTRSLSQFGDDD